MATEVHDLLVRISPEGMKETQGELDNVSESFEDTAGDVGDSTEMMSGFARKFKGAGLVFAATFGTLIGAIASKMPILGETFTTLDILLTTIGLKMDKTVRGPMSDFNEMLLETNKEMQDAEGGFEALAIGIGGLQLAQIQLLADAFGGLADDLADVATSGGDASATIGSLANMEPSLNSQTLEQQLDVLTEKFDTTVTSAKDARTLFRNIEFSGNIPGVNDLATQLQNLSDKFDTSVDSAKDARRLFSELEFKDNIPGVDSVSSQLQTLTDKFDGTVKSAKDARRLFSELDFSNEVNTSGLSALEKQLKNLEDQFDDTIETAREARRIFREIEFSESDDEFGPEFPGAPPGLVGDPPGPPEDDGTGGGSGGSGGSGGGPRPMAVETHGTVESETNLDGRTVSEETKPFTVTGTLTRGRGSRLR